jgi:hypothetical protein
MMVCKNLVVGKAVCFGRSLPGISQLTEMGGHSGSRRRAVIGLDLRPHTKEMWTSQQLGCATRLRSLMGKATHLCRVYQIVACHSLFRETKGTTNAAGKELYLSSNQPVKADGHSSSE